MAGADVLVTGAGGQLGRSVVAEAERRGLTVFAAGHDVLAVEDRDAVARVWQQARPAAVIHCGAWTDVDGCEGDPERAECINGVGTAHVAGACAAGGIPLVHVSTDFVFDGRGTRPYRPDDPVAPLSAYGRSKRSGEEAVLGHGRKEFTVVRTSWVFGPGGRNFPAAILRRARAGGPLKVVDDQVGRPTYTPDLAAALLDVLELRPGDPVLHAANEGECSWHGFAVELVTRAGLDVPVGRMSSAELDRPAPRPAYSVLDTTRTTALRGRPLPGFADAVARYLREEES